MPQSTTEKRSRFARVFPDRVERVVDQFRLISNCNSPANYEWTRDTVAKVWVHILEAMVQSAEGYGLKLSFTINGRTLSEVASSGSIQSLFETEQPQGEVQRPLF